MEHNQELIELGMKLMKENYPHLVVLKINVIQGSGIKTVWKLETSMGTVCLKRIRKSLPIVKFTTAAQAYLSAKGALVASIVPTKEGQLYFVHEGYALVLYTWIEGKDLVMDQDWEHLCTALKGIAQFHLDSVGFVPPKDCEVYDRMGVWPSHYAKMCEELTEWKGQAEQKNTMFHQAYVKTAAEIIPLAKQAIQLLRASCYTEWVNSIGKYGYLCHQDYGKGNALKTEAGVYILDLDNLAYDIPLRDVRKLIVKWMDQMESWNARQLEDLIDCYTSILPLSDEQKRVLYIDLLYPHKYYGYAKSPFKKGEAGEVKKIMESYQAEKMKLRILTKLLQID